MGVRRGEFEFAAALLLFSDVVCAAETCLSQPQLFGVIFGSVGAAFLISFVIALLLWICLRSSHAEKKTAEKSAYANAACDVEERGVDAKRTSHRDKMTMIDSFKLRKRSEEIGTQKAYSMEYINEVDGKVGVQLTGEDIGGLGFNVQGNMNEGIFVRNLVPHGIADQCGNILVGDRIKSLTINFESIVYEDAVTLLNYASPYKVKLELERKLTDTISTDESEDEREIRYHPLFRSNTLTHVHFNPVGSSSTASPKPLRSASNDTTQKHELPKQETAKIAEPDSTQSESSPVSKCLSSDYGSDATSYDDKETDSTNNNSDKSIATQKTISDRVEITDIIFDTIHSPSPPPQTRREFCAELPPKKKILARSPSPKIVHKPPPSPKVHRATSPQKAVTAEDSTQTALKAQEAKPTQTEEEVPIPPPVSSIPVRKEVAPPKKTSSKPPEITEVRVSRIPKRAESIKTPIVERKLPKLPSNVTQRSHSADKNDDVWSRLYLEKKGQLRKTRDLVSPPPPTSSALSPAAKMTSEEKYGTLTRERRDRLEANDAELERQREELRKLGVL